jgi:hypothetical protein
MVTALALLQSDNNGGIGAIVGGGIGLFVALAILVIVIAGFWKVFTKAGQPGWASLIPFYNVYILLKVAGRPGWWLILCFIPPVNLIVAILLAVDVAKAFGQSPAFGFLLCFMLAGIGYLILGFGNYQYQRTAVAVAG